MFHALIQSYADAMYVAATLRPPASARPVRESECFAACEVRSRTRSSSRVARRIAGWLQTRFGRGLAATAEPVAPIQPIFVRAPHS
jgi:hypothetical protein